ncbi:ATP-binding protein [Streptomyces sp. NPDC048650]|uniref:ATP-binding protein n=1 Tax=unclassified Streptomyces TaxID=2593676 RepID=UPI00371B0B0F
MTRAAEIPTTAAEARDRVHDLLEICLRTVDEVVLTDALLITSELVTNALRHAGGLTAFTARVVDDRFEVAVEDASPVHPSLPGDRPVAAIGGYGWPMVRQLATSLAITPTAGGKCIHAALRLW